MRRFHGHEKVLAIEMRVRTLALEEVDPVAPQVNRIGLVMCFPVVKRVTCAEALPHAEGWGIYVKVIQVKKTVMVSGEQPVAIKLDK